MISDHLLDGGGEPGRVLAAELPRFRLKRRLRWTLDLAPPNILVESALRLGLTRRIAQEIFFHRRGSSDPEAYRRFLRKHGTGPQGIGSCRPRR